MRKIYIITLTGIRGDTYRYSSYNNFVHLVNGWFVIETTIKGTRSVDSSEIHRIEIDESF